MTALERRLAFEPENLYLGGSFVTYYLGDFG